MTDIGRLSRPGALSSLSSSSSFICARSKLWRDEEVSCVRYSLKETGVIMLAKLGPTFAKYWQNLFSISWESVITSWSTIDQILIGLRFVHVDLMSFLFLVSIGSYYCFLASLKSLVNLFLYVLYMFSLSVVRKRKYCWYNLFFCW